MNEVTRARRVCAAAWHAAFSPTVEFWTEDKVGRPEASRSRHSACWNPNDAGSHPRLGHAALTAKVACRPGWHADGWMDGGRSGVTGHRDHARGKANQAGLLRISSPKSSRLLGRGV
ncbi:unnamed protein product, partial [Diplocarpon coronariae]